MLRIFKRQIVELVLRQQQCCTSGLSSSSCVLSLLKCRLIKDEHVTNRSNAVMHPEWPAACPLVMYDITVIHSYMARLLSLRVMLLRQLQLIRPAACSFIPHTSGMGRQHTLNVLCLQFSYRLLLPPLLSLSLYQGAAWTASSAACNTAAMHKT
jgi:hypothetical protein